MAQNPVRYSDDVETELPNEADLADESIATMRNTMTQGFEVHRHMTSGTRVDEPRHAAQYLRTVLGTAKTHPSPTETIFDRTPNIHPLAFTFYSQAAFRYGDYVAKFAVTPATSEQLELADKKVGKDDPPGVLKDWVREFFAGTAARYELQVQLQTDRDSQPVEDASAEWSQNESPYRTVATIELPPQESWSNARRVFAEDVMRWQPWWSLAAHRPLGSLNRLRNRVYTELGTVRHESNAVTEVDPVSLADVPD